MALCGGRARQSAAVRSRMMKKPGDTRDAGKSGITRPYGAQADAGNALFFSSAMPATG